MIIQALLTKHACTHTQKHKGDGGPCGSPGTEARFCSMFRQNATRPAPRSYRQCVQPLSPEKRRARQERVNFSKRGRWRGSQSTKPIGSFTTVPGTASLSYPAAGLALGGWWGQEGQQLMANASTTRAFTTAGCSHTRPAVSGPLRSSGVETSVWTLDLKNLRSG